MFLGITLLVLGSLGALTAVDLSSFAGFFAGTFVSGVGFGAGFQGGMRTVVPLIAEHERPGVLSAVYVVCYLGMGLPAFIAGILVVHGGGLAAATRDYSWFVVALAVVTLIASCAAKRRWPRPDTRTRQAEEGLCGPEFLSALAAPGPGGSEPGGVEGREHAGAHARPGAAPCPGGVRA
jgi:MFS family permease